MIQSLKKASLRVLAETFGGGRVPRFFQLRVVPDHFAILMYHGVVDEPLTVEHPCFVERREFKKQIEYLQQHCQMVGLEEAVRLSREGKIDSPTAVVTFDDGLQNNYDIAYPILQQFQVPATIFLTTNYIGSDRTIWSYRLHDAIQSTDRVSLSWRGDTIALDSPTVRAKSSRFLRQQLKNYDPNRIERELHEILAALGVDPKRPISKGSDFRMLDQEAIQVMNGSGLITFGAHTDTHVILSRVRNSVKQEEIGVSLERVSQWTGEKCKLFAYPNGQPQDYDDTSIEMLRRNGVEAAVTTVSGGNLTETPRLELRRYGVGPRTQLRMFRLRVHHLLPYARKLVSQAVGK